MEEWHLENETYLKFKLIKYIWKFNKILLNSPQIKVEYTENL